MGEGIANILAEAVAHAEQCLTLIASAQERPGEILNILYLTSLQAITCSDI